MRRRCLLKAGCYIGLSGLLPFASASTITLHRDGKLFACARQAGEDHLVILRPSGLVIGSLQLPARGHGIALHPYQASGVVFARRPGHYLVKFDTDTAALQEYFQLPHGRQMNGHGVFDNDGLLYVSEGNTATSEGIIGVYRAEGRIQKVAEFSGFGTGPHEIKLHPDNRHLVIAVGGIRTCGRKKMNLDIMQPALVYLDKTNGKVTQQITLEHHQLSIRHLAVDREGRVVFACQYQGEDEILPLVYQHQLNQSRASALQGEEEQWQRFNDYVGSITMDDTHVYATSPRGNCFGSWNKRSGSLKSISSMNDVCGVTSSSFGLTLSTGTGVINTNRQPAQTLWHWDNHIISI